MGAIAIVTLILAVPTALTALFTLLEKAKGAQNNTNPTASERGAAQYVYELTCVYAPKAFLVVSIFSFNYQNANPIVQSPGSTSTPSSPSLVATEANHVVGHGTENSDAPRNDMIGELPRPVQDGHH